jgi:hypothetical protein
MTDRTHGCKGGDSGSKQDQQVRRPAICDSSQNEECESLTQGTIVEHLLPLVGVYYSAANDSMYQPKMYLCRLWNIISYLYMKKWTYRLPISYKTRMHILDHPPTHCTVYWIQFCLENNE